MATLQVLDGCDGFSLNPDEHKDIDIAFTPDFTLSQVSRTLLLHSTLSPPHRTINFTMAATLPTSLVSQCAAVLPRPVWESYLYYGANAFMVGALVIVLVAAFYESDRILKCTVMLPLLTKGAQPRQPPFDLRHISKDVNSELKSQPDINILNRPVLATLPRRLLAWPLRVIKRLNVWKDEPPEEEPQMNVGVVAEVKQCKPQQQVPKGTPSTGSSKKGGGRKKQQQLRRRMNTSKMNSSSDFNDNADASSTTTEEDYCAIVNNEGIINTNDLISSATIAPVNKAKNVKKSNNKKQPKQQQQSAKKPTTTTTAETIIKKQQQQQQVKVTKDKKPKQQQQQQQQQQPLLSTPTPPITHHQPSLFNTAKPANKPNPAVAKILPEPKKPENLGATFGPIGTTRSSSAWSNSPAEAKPPVSCSLLGRPVEKPLSPTAMMTPGGGTGGGTGDGVNQPGSPVHRHMQQYTRGLSSGSPFHHPTAVGPIGAGFGQQQQQQQQQQYPAPSQVQPTSTGSTFMQSLQLERRQRTEEYLRNRTEWPGFGEDDTQLEGRNYLASLWDNTEEPRGSTTAQLDDIWPNSWGTSSFGVNHHQDEVLSVVEQQQQQQQSGLGFNPTQLTASVWSSEQENNKVNNNQEQKKSQNNCWSSTLFKN